MQENEVPQDGIQTYSGLKKLLYATDEEGNYTSVTSSGWEVEELINSMAVDELHQLSEEALQRVRAGESSPLEYYMYKYRLDLPQLAQASGLFRWRVRRHMRPEVWHKLNDRLLARYADVFGLDIPTLKKSLF